MNFLDYIVTSIGSATILAFAVFLFKSMLLERLKASVQHEFNEKLTKLQDSLKQRSEEISYLRSNLLEGVSERNKLLYTEKIKAVKMIWANINALAPGKQVATQAKAINYEVALKRSEHEVEVQDFFKKTFTDKALKQFSIEDAYLARPYLSEYAWLLFRAYSSIIVDYIMKVEILKIGIGTELGDSEFTLAIVKAALPEHAEYIDEYKMNGAFYLLEELESRLLKELKAILDGTDDDIKHMKTITALNEAFKEAAKEKEIS